MTTPLLPMHTLGHDFVPEPIHAGGLRYHGMAPIVSHLVKEQLVEARAFHPDRNVYGWDKLGPHRGFIPAPETNHVIAAVVQEAMRRPRKGKGKVILFNSDGWQRRGRTLASFSMPFLSGSLIPYELPEEEIQRALKSIANFPKP